MAGAAGYGVARQEAFAGCSEVEIAWAAGLFEGEGCLTFSNSQQKFATASINMVDFDVVERFALLCGVGSVYRERQQEARGWKPQLKWSASGIEAVGVATVLLPHFGDRRRKRATEILEWYEETYLRECSECDQVFISRRRNALYCSRTCTNKAAGRKGTERRRAKAALLPAKTVDCQRCGTTFTIKRTVANAKWCPECQPGIRRSHERSSKARHRERYNQERRERRRDVQKGASI